MEIHKPKPWHGSREFLKEIGTIVIGVLIALGAEQAVEWLHWRDQMGQTRESLRAEIENNLAVEQDRARETPCVDRRLAEIHAILAAHAQGRPLRLVAAVGRPRDGAIYSNAASAAQSAGVLVHMPLRERQEDQSLYDQFRFVADLQLSERTTWGALALLDDQSVLTEASWPLILRSYADARNLNERLSTGLPGTIHDAAQAGYHPGGTPPSTHLPSVCIPIIARPSNVP